MDTNRKPDCTRNRLLDNLAMYLHERGRKIDSWVNYNDLPSREMLRDVEEWKALGATHLSINTMNCAMKFPDEHIRAIATFKDGISA